MKKNIFEKLVIITRFPRRVARDSSGFTQRQARQLVHKSNKIFLNFLLGGHDPEAAAGNGVPYHGFVWIFRKWTIFECPQHHQSPKLCAKRSISTQELPTKKKSQKMFFRNIFHFFRHLKIQNIAILPFRDTSIEKT